MCLQKCNQRQPGIQKLQVTAADVVKRTGGFGVPFVLVAGRDAQDSGVPPLVATACLGS